MENKTTLGILWAKDNTKQYLFNYMQARGLIQTKKEKLRSGPEATCKTSALAAKQQSGQANKRPAAAQQQQQQH